MKSIDESYRDLPDEERERARLQEYKAEKPQFRWFSMSALLFCSFLLLLIVGIVHENISRPSIVATSCAARPVYTHWRYAMDLMEGDLAGCILLDGSEGRTAGPTYPGGRTDAPREKINSKQAVWMENGFLVAPGALPSYNGRSSASDMPGDRMSFRTSTFVKDSIRYCEVTYELIPGNMMLDHLGNLQLGYDSRIRKTDPDRQLFTLVRRVRTVDPASDPAVYDQLPQFRDPVTGTMDRVLDQEVCQNVFSFNLEYYSSDATFSELEPSPFPRLDPPENLPGSHDTKSQYFLSAVRVTLVVGDRASKGQERTIQRVFWLPAQ